MNSSALDCSHVSAYLMEGTSGGSPVHNTRVCVIDLDILHRIDVSRAHTPFACNHYHHCTRSTCIYPSTRTETATLLACSGNQHCSGDGAATLVPRRFAAHAAGLPA
jgi:hypothetical protein